jgi:hypothetical protein
VPPTAPRRRRAVREQLRPDAALILRVGLTARLGRERSEQGE